MNEDNRSLWSRLGRRLELQEFVVLVVENVIELCEVLFSRPRQLQSGQNEPHARIAGIQLGDEDHIPIFKWIMQEDDFAFAREHRLLRLKLLDDAPVERLARLEVR